MLAVLLICTIGQQPWECQRTTARSVLTHETAATLPYACLIEAQQFAAMNSVTARVRSDEWVKVSCEPGKGEPTDDEL